MSRRSSEHSGSTTTERLEELFEGMATAQYATSTIDRTWGYLNQAGQYDSFVSLVADQLEDLVKVADLAAMSTPGPLRDIAILSAFHSPTP